MGARSGSDWEEYDRKEREQCVGQYTNEPRLEGTVRNVTDYDYLDRTPTKPTSEIRRTAEKPRVPYEYKPMASFSVSYEHSKDNPNPLSEIEMILKDLNLDKSKIEGSTDPKMTDLAKKISCYAGEYVNSVGRATNVVYIALGIGAAAFGVIAEKIWGHNLNFLGYPMAYNNNFPQDQTHRVNSDIFAYSLMLFSIAALVTKTMRYFETKGPYKKCLLKCRIAARESKMVP